MMNSPFRSGSQTASSGKNAGLFFSPDEAAALRKRFETVPYLLPRWRLLQKNADALLSTPLVRGPLDINRTRSSLGNIGITAFAFALTQNRAYADRALREANALLDEATWTKPSPANRGANLATGEAGVACALAYDWCRTILTEAEQSAFRGRLFARCVQPYLEAVGPLKDWWRDNDVTNWSGVVNGGCGLAALVLADSLPAARAAAEFAWGRVAAFLKTANRADGGGDEGVMYYTYGMLFANYFAVAASRYFGEDRGVFRDAVEKMSGYYLVGMQGSDGKYANFNDMGDETFANMPPKNPEGGPNATLCALWESKTPGGDRLLAWAADNGGDTWYWRGVSPFALLFRSNSPAVRSRPVFPRSTLFRESGQAVWDAAPGFWFAFNGGWTSDRSHYNLDLGSFVLVTQGERLIWDPGYGKTKTSDHSTLLVNAQEQSKNVNGVYEAWAEGVGWRWLACDLSAVYTGGVVTRWVRHAILLEDGPTPILLLLDDLGASRPAHFETRVQIKGSLTIRGTSAWVQGNKTALNLTWALGDEGVAEIQAGKAASDYVQVRIPETSKARLITALCPALPDTAASSIALKTVPAIGNGINVTVSHATREKVLTFVPDIRGRLCLTAINGRPTPNLPGPERRSLRRVT